MALQGPRTVLHKGLSAPPESRFHVNFKILKHHVFMLINMVCLKRNTDTYLHFIHAQLCVGVNVGSLFKQIVKLLTQTLKHSWKSAASIKNTISRQTRDA